MKDIARLLVALTLIASISGLILAQVEQVTREPIKEQRRLQMLKALDAVLPEYDNSPDQDTVSVESSVDTKDQPIETIFYRARKQGELVGTAFTMVAPNGYSGNIAVMIGILPNHTVNAIEILNHAETPGLGDKIEEPWFKEMFAGKELDHTDWRVKKDGGDFDQLTGATISTRAVVDAVARGLKLYRDKRAKIHSKGVNP